MALLNELLYTIGMRNGKETQQVSNRSDLPHQRFDIVAKDAIYTFPEDIVQFLMQGSEIAFLEHLESEFTTVETRQMDSLIKVLLNGEQALVHCEFQTSDSTHLDMVRRSIGYLGRCYERYGLPIFSHVVYFRPDAGGNDPGSYIQEVPGYRFIVEYKVIRLIEVEGQAILETRQPGLMPFCPLMKRPVGMDASQWIHRCVETTKSLSLDAPIRNNLLLDLWVMSGLVHEPQAIANLFPEDIMQESSVYQHIIEKGRAEGIEQGIERGKELGAKESTIEGILLLLDTRFEADTTHILKPALEAIDDLQRLKHLLREAAETQSLETFISNLITNGDSA